MRKVALLVVVVVLLALVVVSKGTNVEVTCGPAVTTPVGVKAIEGAQGTGEQLRGLIQKPRSDIGLVRLAIKAFRFITTLGGAFSDSLNGERESSAVTGWKTQTKQKQQAAMASCCPPGIPQGDHSPTTPPQDTPPPFDPRTASLQTGSDWTPEKIAAAAVTVGQQQGIPRRGWVIIVAAGYVESEMRNPPYGDRDSVGWLQQRASWGSFEDRMNPPVAAGKFYDRLVRVPNWQSRPMGEVAQAVQVSAFPDRYAARVADAERLVARVAGGQAEARIDTAPAQPAPTFCPTPVTGGGDLNGALTKVAELNPQGAGNWQGAVLDGSYWYVAHAYRNDQAQIIHRLDRQGRELDQMSAVGFMHATSFAVIDGTVFATDGQWRVVTFPYRPGSSVRRGEPTGWRGYISKDPDGPNVVVRNGNRYRVFNFASRRPVGVEVVTDVGQRQGFSMSGTTVYVLTGPTNQPARIDAYSVTTGQLTGTRDITSLAADRAGSHREPEGMVGNLVGIKANVGDRRRLLMYRIDPVAAPKPDGPRNSQGLTPRAQQARTVTFQRWGCANRPAPCVRSIGGFSDRNIGGTNVKSDHASGNAIDIMVSAHTSKVLGDQIATYFVANHQASAVKYVIWNRRIWSPQRSSEGWRPYSGASAHTDHVHVSVLTGATA